MLYFFPEDGGSHILQNVYTYSRLHGITSHETVILTFTTLRILNPLQMPQFCCMDLCTGGGCSSYGFELVLGFKIYPRMRLQGITSQRPYS